MTLAALTIEFSRNKRSLKEISINQLMRELPLERLLFIDRASYCLFEQTPIAMNSRSSQENPVLWGGSWV